MFLKLKKMGTSSFENSVFFIINIIITLIIII